MLRGMRKASSKLARQDRHYNGDGPSDRQLRGVGHRRHFPRIRPIDPREGRLGRDRRSRRSARLHTTSLQQLGRQLRPSDHAGPGARARPRPAPRPAGRRRPRSTQQARRMRPRRLATRTIAEHHHRPIRTSEGLDGPVRPRAAFNDDHAPGRLHRAALALVSARPRLSAPADRTAR